MVPSLLFLGRSLELLQTTPALFQAAADTLKIKPLVLVDGCPLYHEADIAKIGKHLRPPPQMPVSPPTFQKTTVVEKVKDGEVVDRRTIITPLRAPRTTSNACKPANNSS